MPAKKAVPQRGFLRSHAIYGSTGCVERYRGRSVQAVLASLPADQHAVVTLSYLDGLSHSEIAGKLGLPLGTVKSRMRLAYQKIREAVEDLK
jgi:RNA polymerase sigma-70 factor, ECF subfamily